MSMNKKNKVIALIILAVCIVSLSGCALLLGKDYGPKYEIAGTWRRTAGQFNSTITYYFKADGTFSYSNNQNGDLDSGTYTVNWDKHIIYTNPEMNHSLDKKLSFSFKRHDLIVINGYEYTRI